ncbi:MAG TPA: cupin domain-containing protein [Geobacteraceae bacterium]|nr:cupin domain-containing protein [Geobacteraceae bacterium]
MSTTDAEQTKRALNLEPEVHGKMVMRGTAEEKSLREIIRMLDADILESEQFMGGLATFQKGITEPMHVHPDAEEINIILEGEGQLITDKDVIICKPGEWQFIPKGVPHSHSNQNDAPFRFAWLYSPPTKSVPKG